MAQFKLLRFSVPAPVGAPLVTIIMMMTVHDQPERVSESAWGACNSSRLLRLGVVQCAPPDRPGLPVNLKARAASAQPAF
eukprot:144494-Rhodomonas_salina.2